MMEVKESEILNQGVKNRDIKEQLRLRSERTPSRSFEKKIRLDIVKRIPRSSARMWKMWNWTSLRSRPLWNGESRNGHYGGVSPLQKGRKPTSYGIRRARHVGAPATVGREREERKLENRMIAIYLDLEC
jgi:hypothetical protein